MSNGGNGRFRTRGRVYKPTYTDVAFFLSPGYLVHMAVAAVSGALTMAIMGGFGARAYLELKDEA